MKQSHPDWEKLVSDYDVSRETIEKLCLYHDTLIKWQCKINLISPSTLDNSIRRHFLDSAQLFPLLSEKENPIFDFGSGAGFPGLVLSIMGATNVTLVESDQRKCVFLSEVIRQTDSAANVLNARIETITPAGCFTTVTSRACASLDQLLHWAFPLMYDGGECLFLKGRNAGVEIEQAQKQWVFHVEQRPSASDDEGRILRIRDLRKRA